MYKFKQGFYSDVRIENRTTTRLELRNGVLHGAKTTSEKKAFLRVYDGKSRDAFCPAGARPRHLYGDHF